MLLATISIQNHIHSPSCVWVVLNLQVISMTSHAINEMSIHAVEDAPAWDDIFYVKNVKYIYKN